MSVPWSSNPNAPQIPPKLYSWEKTNFAGYIIGSILHGIVIVLFFQCMNALVNPTNRTGGGNRWGLLAHTVAMFTNATISLAIGLYVLPGSYINGREFPGGDGLPPGPYGYSLLPQFATTAIVANSVVQVNQWLADGLLLYRCYIIYGMNYWAVAFPFLMYLACWATGIGLIWADTLPYDDYVPSVRWGNSYYSIALSLNVVLTLMIITRLVLHNRNIRKAIGTLDRVSGLYSTITAMLVESGVLYAVSFLLLVGPWASRSIVELITFQILPEVQCIAPFLIILRVANRTALTSEAVASGNLGSIHFKSRGESTGVEGTIVDEKIVASIDERGEASGEHSAVAENAVEEVPS